MRDYPRGALALLAGCLLIVVALALIWVPLALLAAGGMLCAGGLLSELDAALPRQEDDEA